MTCSTAIQCAVRGRPCSAELPTCEHHVNTTVVVGEDEEKEFFWLEDTVLKTKQE